MLTLYRGGTLMVFGTLYYQSFMKKDGKKDAKRDKDATGGEKAGGTGNGEPVVAHDEESQPLVKA